MRRADAVIVGGGAMGSATAWWLAHRGSDVVVLERFEPGHRRGSSHGASRIFRLGYPDDDYVALAVAALPLWRALEDETTQQLLTRTGAIDHGDPESLSAIVAALGRGGIHHDVLSAREGMARWPAMRFEGDVVVQPDGGRVHADDAVRALQHAAVARGAELRFAEPVLSLQPTGTGIVVETATATYEAQVAVVAAGAWAEAVVDGHAVLPPLTVTAEQPAIFGVAPRADEEEWPSFVHYRVGGIGAYGLGTPGEGVKVGEHGTGRAVDPEAGPFAPDSERLDGLCRYVARWLPGLDPHPVSAITCLYTTTPTGDFVIDRQGPLVVVSACSGHGFKFVPVIGRLAADLVAGVATAPSRFALAGRR